MCMGGMYLKRVQTVYDILIANIILNEEKLKGFSATFPTFIQRNTRNLSQSNQIRELNKEN